VAGEANKDSLSFNFFVDDGGELFSLSWFLIAGLLLGVLMGVRMGVLMGVLMGVRMGVLMGVLLNSFSLGLLSLSFLIIVIFFVWLVLGVLMGVRVGVLMGVLLNSFSLGLLSLSRFSLEGVWLSSSSELSMVTIRLRFFFSNSGSLTSS
jgi:hypothetical protein